MSVLIGNGLHVHFCDGTTDSDVGCVPYRGKLSLLDINKACVALHSIIGLMSHPADSDTEWKASLKMEAGTRTPL